MTQQPIREKNNAPRRRPQRRQSKPKQTQPKLRKQPTLKRVNRTATLAPDLQLPDTVVARRRYRRRQRFSEPLSVMGSFITSARWISGLILGLSIYCFYFMIVTPNFYITVVPVEGLFSISANEIVSISDLAGRHIFAADPAKAAEMIIETPGIISTEVNLSWPNEVNIMVEEETPVAVWKNDVGVFWINRDGHLYPARRSLPGLLTIEVPDGSGVLGQTLKEADIPLDTAAESDGELELETTAPQTPVIDSYGTVPDEILRGALLLQRLQPNNGPLTSLAYDSRNGLSFGDDRGWRVFVGHGEDMEQKLVVYEAIVASLQAEGLQPEYVSVADQERPFYK